MCSLSGSCFVCEMASAICHLPQFTIYSLILTVEVLIQNKGFVSAMKKV